MKKRIERKGVRLLQKPFVSGRASWSGPGFRGGATIVKNPFTGHEHVSCETVADNAMDEEKPRVVFKNVSEKMVGPMMVFIKESVPMILEAHRRHDEQLNVSFHQMNGYGDDDKWLSNGSATRPVVE